MRLAGAALRRRTRLSSNVERQVCGRASGTVLLLLRVGSVTMRPNALERETAQKRSIVAGGFGVGFLFMNIQITWKLLALVLAVSMRTYASAGESAQPRDVRLEVTDSGQYILSGEPVALADLRVKLRELKSAGGPINLHVIGGSKVEYRFVMPAMQIVQEEGLAKVGYITVPPVASDSAASSSSK